MPFATYSVQASWATGPKAPTWVDITADVLEVRTKRGRASDLVTMQQGTATLTLSDPTGKYNPQNPASPLAGQLLPMRPIKVTATYSGTTYPLFYGYVSRIEADQDTASLQTTIELVDFYEFLNYGFPTVPLQATNRVDALIGTMLDTLGWTAGVLARNLQVSANVVPAWSADGTKDALTLIQDLLTVDLGLFFAGADGRPTYLPHTVRYANTPPLATFAADHLSAGKGTTDVQQIVNRQSVQRTPGGTAQTATDATSGDAYGYRDGSQIQSDYLRDDNQANALARFLVLSQAQPVTPARQVTIDNRDATSLVQMLSREIGDTVTVEGVPGGSITGPIQSIQHEITQGGRLHKATYAVSAALIKVFTIGVSKIGGTDVLGY